MSWTDERVETLKKMWSDGQSASQIAKELGGVTRNAVIGKVHRLGLSNRVGGVAGAARPGAGGHEGGNDGGPDSLHDGEDDDFDDGGAQGDAPGSAPIAEPAPRVMADARPDTKPADPKPADSPAAERVAAPATITAIMPRKQIIPAGQPLPPQPSANEISPEALASVREVEKKAKKLTLMELTERTCKWPIGDPATPDFWFCGLGTQPGKPYCEAHVGVAFQPMSSRRDRRR